MTQFPYFTNEPMSKHTSFKIGGPADVFAMPQNEEQLQKALNFCKDGTFPAPAFILGNGSNLLVGDGGIRGTVISLLGLDALSIDNEGIIHAGAGVSMKKLAEFAQSHGVAGFEFAHGIPGSVGGGVFMNAGAYEGEMSQIFHKARCMNKNGDIVEIDHSQAHFAYRKSFAAEKGLIITSVQLRGTKGDKTEIAKNMAELHEKRNDKQPLDMPSAGSIFKRPPGHFAGKLIMDAGLRGFAIGDAQVSEKHCGFIVNKGNATAAGVLALIAHIQAVVMEKFGIALETEVKIVGAWR